MSITTSLVFLSIVFLFILLYTRDLFHPSCIVCLEWGWILYLFFYVDHGLYSISNKTVLIALLWTYGFIFSALLSSKKTIKISTIYAQVNCSKYAIKILFLPLVICNFALIFLIVLKFGISPLAIRQGLLKPLPIYIKILFYANTFSYVYLIAIILDGDGISKLAKIGFCLLIVICSFIKMNKTSFLSLFLLLIITIHYRHKLSFKAVLFLILALITLIVILVKLRDDASTIQDFSIKKYLFIYILSPLGAFNQLVNGDVVFDTNIYGSQTFVFFSKVLNLIPTMNLKTSIFGPWCNVPLPTNVYTVFLPYYVDFGILGVFVFSIVQGLFWGWVYHYQKKGYRLFQLFYAVYIYSLVLQFFSEYFFYTMSVIIQYFIFAIILVCKFKDKKFLKFSMQ